MNILTDTLPDFITVNGVRFRVLTDFRIWMEFDSLMHCYGISAKDKSMMALSLCLDGEKKKILPEDALGVMEELCKFYLCGRSSRGTEKNERAIDFEKDSTYIYSAFLTQYGIDLISIPYMHWYAFYALFEGLEDSRKIIKIMKFRLSNPDEEKNAEKRKYLKRMKELYSLSDTSCEDISEKEIADILFRTF